MRLLARFLPPLFLFACGAASAAESAYVIDKLLVGIHESKDTDSAILKVVPTGIDVKAFASKTLPTLKAHLQMIRDIASKMSHKVKP